MTGYVKEIHLGISEWFINIQIASISTLLFTQPFSAKHIELTTLKIFFRMEVITAPYLLVNKFLIGVQHIVTQHVSTSSFNLRRLKLLVQTRKKMNLGSALIILSQLQDLSAT